CTEAIRLNKDDGMAHEWRGYLLAVRGDLDEAIRSYGEAIRLHPRSARLYAGRARAYAGKGDATRALADLDEALRLFPNDLESLRAPLGASLGDGTLGRGPRRPGYDPAPRPQRRGSPLRARLGSRARGPSCRGAGRLHRRAPSAAKPPGLFGPAGLGAGDVPGGGTPRRPAGARRRAQGVRPHRLGGPGPARHPRGVLCRV